MTNYQFVIIVEKKVGGYFASFNELQDCYTQGETFDEVIENVKDIISLHIKDRIIAGEKIQMSKYVSLLLLVRLYERKTVADKSYRGEYLDCRKIRLYLDISEYKP